jgi:hypothetical protein
MPIVLKSASPASWNPQGLTFTVCIRKLSFLSGLVTDLRGVTSCIQNVNHFESAETALININFHTVLQSWSADPPILGIKQRCTYMNNNQHDELFVFTLLSYHISTCFGRISSPSSGGYYTYNVAVFTKL